MFYSRQLLARKAPLGQIWRAATTHMKINRRKLNKINIIKICEEILNPSVPMALRLSGILMGGVVLVYEQKVKLLHDDVNSLMIEINRAWKVKAVVDPTLLPKGKSKAKKEAVTMPEYRDTDLGDIEQSLNFSNANATATMSFQQTAYFAMELDNIDDAFINGNAMDEDPNQRSHQVAPEDITLFERFDPNQADETMFNRYERFDGRIDEELESSGPHTRHTLIPSPPPPQEEPQRASKINEENNFEPQFNQMDDGDHLKQVVKEQVQRRKKTRIAGCLTVDDHTVVPAHIYQSWLQDPSDIVSKGQGRKGKRAKVTLSVKTTNLKDLPSTILIMEGLFKHRNKEVYYPTPLMELWRQSFQSLPSETTNRQVPPETSESHLTSRKNFQDPMDTYFEDFQSGIGSQSLNYPQPERHRDVFADEPTKELLASLSKAANKETDPLATPGNSGFGTAPSSGSGNELRGYGSGSNAGRVDKKRPHSSSRHSYNSLDPVAEENGFFDNEPNFQLRRLSAYNGLTPDRELLVETGPTQTQRAVLNQHHDHITESIRMQLKTHFDTPGAPKAESLDNLAQGMNSREAAQLFYQTCVLASLGALKVKQIVPFGEILISKGAKM